jgi:DNA-binding MarR family transcriptional regulator
MQTELIAQTHRGALGLWQNVTQTTIKADGPDLTSRQTALMLMVYLEKGPHTVRGLARALGLAKPAIVRGIDTLEAAGLLSRQPDPADRRNVFIVGTQKGSHHLAEFAGLIARNAAQLTSAFLAPGPFDLQDAA